MKSFLAAWNRFKYLILIPIALMWIMFLVSHFIGMEFSGMGVLPRTISGLQGILLMPFAHANLEHISSNTYPILVLGFILISSYPKISYEVMLIIYLLTGAMVWMLARGETYHIGASGIVYGLAVFVIATGFLNRDIRSSALAFLVIFIYGGTIVSGILPIYEGISWEAHLFGGIVGAGTAYLYRKPSAEAKIEREEQKRFFEEH